MLGSLNWSDITGKIMKFQIYKWEFLKQF
jgi:hypothetical protein